VVDPQRAGNDSPPATVEEVSNRCREIGVHHTVEPKPRVATEQPQFSDGHHTCAAAPGHQSSEGLILGELSGQLPGELRAIGGDDPFVGIDPQDLTGAHVMKRRVSGVSKAVVPRLVGHPASQVGRNGDGVVGGPRVDHHDLVHDPNERGNASR